MAKCDLSVELDEPDRIYLGGETITGTVTVVADADVKCKSLEIRSGWRTHGRGNVASGSGDSVSVFSGDWRPGQREAYRFEVTVMDWPPSYHGNYINVDHVVDARAKIAWSFDPKASTAFMMRPLSCPDAAAAKSSKAAGCFGHGVLTLILGGVAAGLFAGFAAAAQSFVGIVIMSAITALIVGFLVFKFYLPKWLLGKVDYELLTTDIVPGDTVRARLSFEPRRRFPINSVMAAMTGSEVCVSGSGSNKTTHTNVFFDDKTLLKDKTVLEPGERQSYEYEFKVPEDVPYSFTLSDNKVSWVVSLRVDIPRWPDWATTMNLNIVPNGDRPQNAVALEHDRSSTPAHVATEDPGSGEITFAETAQHLYKLRHDRDQVDMLVEAVMGMTFDIDTFIERRLLYSGQEDPHVYKDGYAVWARHGEPPLPLVLYIPHAMGDEFEQAGRNLWHCRGTIIGWDHDHGRLQVKVIPE